MMFRLEKSFRCEAAHKLPYHDGKCARLHGHSWVIIVAVEGEDTTLHTHGPKGGMLVDYGDIKSVVQPIVDEYLDHHYLNETLELVNPTSEEIAKWLFTKIKATGKLPLLREVIIEETCTSRCVYRPRFAIPVA